MDENSPAVIILYYPALQLCIPDLKDCDIQRNFFIISWTPFKYGEL